MMEELASDALPQFSLGKRFGAALLGMSVGGFAFAAISGLWLSILVFLPVIIAVDLIVSVIPWFAAVYLLTRRALSNPWLFGALGAITGFLGMTAFTLGLGGRLLLATSYAVLISLLAGAIGGFTSWYFPHSSLARKQ